jgi:hypothetical protein
VGHSLDIDPAGGNVGRYKHPGAAGAEASQSTLALGLRFVSVNGDGFDTGPAEMPYNPVCTVLCPGEHEHPFERRIAQQCRQQLPFSITRDKDDALIHQLDRSRSGGHGYLDRIVEVILGERGDRLWHGRREQQGLALPWQQRDDAPQGMDKAEVEHPIGLVEDQDLDTGQNEGPAVDQIEQAARRCNEDVDTRRQPSLLGSDRNAAKHDRNGQRQLSTVGAEAVGDLAGQLSGGAEHECPASAGCRRSRRAGEALQDGQCKSGGLAGPGLGDAAEVAATEHGWNCL